MWVIYEISNNSDYLVSIGPLSDGDGITQHVLNVKVIRVENLVFL